ncbi:MAG TPA: substrate-binding domain-containing protein [Treponemataceae bacterium]|nr:substrate-binding domain-containing protein [Treponemataceae bacterium]
MRVRRSTVLFIVLLIATFWLILYSSFLLLRVASGAAAIGKIDPGEPMRWHLVMIGERIDSPFWQEVFAGALEICSERDAVVELVGPALDADRKDTDEYLQYAVAARPNGILAFVDDREESLQALKTAALRGIPVISLENDAFPANRQSFVGVSRYALGNLLGGLVYTCGGATGHALVLLDEESVRSSESIMLSAIQDAVSSYPEIRVTALDRNSMKDMSRDEFLRHRILNDPDLDVILCLTAEDTVLATQAVIELNQSSRISIIAFRESREILDYVRKGIIQAVVAVDARQMGRKAADAMLEYLETGHSNDFVITDLHVITADSLERSRQ